MSEYRRLRFAIVEHDASARHGLVAQIKSDCRVLECAAFNDPRKLTAALRAAKSPYDIIIIDAQAPLIDPPQHLDEFLDALPLDRSCTRLVCLTNTCASDLVASALRGGAHALFHKQDVVPGLVHAALRVRPGTFLYSESLSQWVSDHSLFKTTCFEMVAHWRQHPRLTRHENEVIYACLVEGEDNAAIAQRLGVTLAAVEKTLYRAYDKVIDDRWYSRTGIDEDLLPELTTSKRAHLFYTGLARSNNPILSGFST